MLDKKVEMSIFKFLLTLKREKKKLHYLGLNQWKSVPQEYRQCSFTKFKKFCKNKLLNNHN